MKGIGLDIKKPEANELLAKPYEANYRTIEGQRFVALKYANRVIGSQDSKIQSLQEQLKEAKEDLKQHKCFIAEMNDYLGVSKMESIGSGSIFHQNMEAFIEDSGNG